MKINIAFSEINRMSPFLDDGLIWNVIESLPGHIASQHAHAGNDLPSFGFLQLSFLWWRHQGSSNSQNKRGGPEAHTLLQGLQGRHGGGDVRGEGSSNKNKACFRRYSLAALSCFRENSAISSRGAATVQPCQTARGPLCSAPEHREICFLKADCSGG